MNKKCTHMKTCAAQLEWFSEEYWYTEIHLLENKKWKVHQKKKILKEARISRIKQWGEELFKDQSANQWSQLD